jgi:hypothetical protein
MTGETMIGTYIFKQNGNEIARSSNIITTNGKNAIVQYLSNSSFEWASSIAVGSINTSATVGDLSLKYEIARSPVTLKSYTIGTPNLIVVKGTISSNVAANIYEIGVFPLQTLQSFGTRDQLIINDFSDLVAWSTYSGTPYTSNGFAAQSSYSPRIGLNSINLPAGTIIRNDSLGVNLSSYNTVDTLDILVNVPVSSSGSLSIVLTDVNGLSATVSSYAFDGAITPGYQILSNVLPATIPTLSTISCIDIHAVGASSSITIDALKISVLSEITASNSIVSRSALTTPIAKIYGVPLDIEYYVQLS